MAEGTGSRMSVSCRNGLYPKSGAFKGSRSACYAVSLQVAAVGERPWGSGWSGLYARLVRKWRTVQDETANTYVIEVAL